MQQTILSDLQNAQNRVGNAIRALEQLGEQLGFPTLTGEQIELRSENILVTREETSIYEALENLSPLLANSYVQVKRDVYEERRLSWAGTANEIREMLRVILDTLAPDDEVKAQSWYQPVKKQPDKKDEPPTRKQKTKYIMEQYGASQSVREATDEAGGHLETRIEDLISKVYSRANAATHVSKSRREIQIILKYFEVFAHELLNLE